MKRTTLDTIKLILKWIAYIATALLGGFGGGTLAA